MIDQGFVLSVLGSNLLTAIAVTLIGKALSKRRDRLDIMNKSREFYTGYITDLEKKIDYLTRRVEELLKKDEQKSKTIDEQRENLLKWESYCEELKRSVVQRDKQISLLDEELRILKSERKS